MVCIGILRRSPTLNHPEKNGLPTTSLTLPGGSSGAVYIDPVSDQAERFKAFVHQQGDPVAERAAKDPNHRWHEIAKQEGSKRYINEEIYAGLC